MNAESDFPDLPAVELITDPDVAAALLKPPRLALVAALREPDSASGLARRLKLPRQRLNHHLHELERVGVIRLLKERRRGNFNERILQATARRYLLCPEILGDLGAFGPEDFLGPRDWTSLAALSAHTLSHLALLRAVTGADPPTLTVPSRLCFSSSETLDAFTLELTEQLGRLVRKYHDADAGKLYWFILGAYPAFPAAEDRQRAGER